MDAAVHGHPRFESQSRGQVFQTLASGRPFGLVLRDAVCDPCGSQTAPQDEPSPAAGAVVAAPSVRLSFVSPVAPEPSHDRREGEIGAGLAPSESGGHYPTFSAAILGSLRQAQVEGGAHPGDPGCVELGAAQGDSCFERTGIPGMRLSTLPGNDGGGWGTTRGVGRGRFPLLVRLDQAASIPHLAAGRGKTGESCPSLLACNVIWLGRRLFAT